MSLRVLLLAIALSMPSHLCFSLPDWTPWRPYNQSNISGQVRFQDQVINNEKPKFELEVLIPGSALISFGTQVRIQIWENDLVNNKIFEVQHNVTIEELVNGYSDLLQMRTDNPINEIGASQEEIYFKIIIDREFPAIDSEIRIPQSEDIVVGIYSDDSYEQNDNINSSTSLGANNVFLEGIINGNQNESDWFSCSVSTGSLEVVIDLDHSGGDIDLLLHNSVGTTIGSSITSGDQERIVKTGLANGIYYVRVGHSGVVRNWYDLRIRHSVGPNISTSCPLPTGNIGAQYSISLSAVGGSPPYTWSIASGTLPTGFSLTSGGILSGNPTTTGTSNFTLRVSDATATQTTKPCELSILGPTSRPIPLLPLDGSTVGATPRLAVGNFAGALQYRFRIFSNNNEIRNALSSHEYWTVPAPGLQPGAYTWDCQVQTTSGWSGFFYPRWSFTSTSANYSVTLNVNEIERTASTVTLVLDPIVTNSNGNPVSGQELCITTDFGIFQNGQQTYCDILGENAEPGHVIPFVRLTSDQTGQAILSFSVSGQDAGSSSVQMNLTETVVLPFYDAPSGASIDAEVEPELDWTIDGNFLAGAGGSVLAYPSLQPLPNTPVGVATVSFSSDGSKVLLARNTNHPVFYLYRADTHVLTQHDPSGLIARSVAWSDQTNDFKFAIANGESGFRNEIWIMEGESPVRTTTLNVPAPSASTLISSITWSGHYLAALRGASLFLFDTNTWSLVWSSSYGRVNKRSVVFSPDGAQIAVLGKKYDGYKNIHIYDISSSIPVDSLSVADAAGDYLSVSWSPDGEKLVVGGLGGYLKILDISQRAEEANFNFSGDVYGVAWSNSNVIAAVGPSALRLYAPADVTGPDIVIESPEDNFLHDPDWGALTLSGEIRDLVGLQSATYRINDGPEIPINISLYPIYSVQGLNLPLGQHTITVTAVDRYGNTESIGVTGVVDNVSSLEVQGIVPVSFALDQNFPNPFNPSTTISYALPSLSEVSLRIYDQLGREIKTLVQQIEEPGYKSVEWNSTNNAGEPVASGVYFYRLVAGEFVQTRKLMLLK